MFFATDANQMVSIKDVYTATLVLFDSFYVQTRALRKLVPLIKSSFNQASNHFLVLISKSVLVRWN